MNANKAAVSVVIVTLNEESNIQRCLRAVQWAQEVLVIDSGSEDQTCAIAEARGAKVIKRDWPGDGPQKQFGAAQASHDWVLILDADEEVSAELAASIVSSVNHPANDCYKLHRRSFYLGKMMRHGDWGRDWIVRLFRKSKYQWTEDIAHSRLDVAKSSAAVLEGKLLHHTQDSIASSIEKVNDYSSLSARMLAERDQSGSVVKAVVRGYFAFARSYFLRLGFMDGVHGYLLARQIGLGAYLKYLKLKFDAD